MAASSSSNVAAAPSPSESAPIEDLPFTLARLRLFGQQDAVSSRRRQDRTVALVSRWKATTETLPKIRQALLSCLEPVEGKGDVVTMRVCDRPRFDAIKETIAINQAEIAALESAIRELNSFAATDFLIDLHDNRSVLNGVEGQVKAALSNESMAAIARGRRNGYSPEVALEKDEVYSNRRQKAESQIETSKRNLEAVNEKIARIESILDRVGC